MLAKRAGLAAIAVIVAGVATVASAGAGTRVWLDSPPFGASSDDYYYGQPYFVPAPRYYYYRPAPRLRPHPRYYAYQYEPDYYEPEVDPNYTAPPRSRAYIPPPNNRKTTSLPPQKSLGKPATKQSATTMTCEKATGIVSGYGFTQVKATSCSGKTYAFNAQRDGKPFTIKLSSASGELTEVKKQ